MTMPNNTERTTAMEYNAAVDEFQGTEYPMLQGKVYLDHGGSTVYAKSLIDTFASDLGSNLYGNPHSASSPAKLSGQLVDDTRGRMLRFLGADPEHFDLVFVANATAAIKLVMDCFRDLGNQGGTAAGHEAGGFWYGYHVDSHNSLVGVRECCDSRYHLFRTDSEVDQWLAGPSLLNRTGKLGLFAYPGQSNMTGRRLPLGWPGQLRTSTHPSHQDTYSLLDAAALATTSPLNRVFQDPYTAPDFTALSFYKIFGFPDLGGLIIRKASGRILQYRRYFGGGTVSLVTVLDSNPWHESKEILHESLEDGTLPFHSIIALSAAIDTHERLYGSDPMTTISRHTNFLGKRLYNAMVSLQHPNGAPVCKIYTGAAGKSTYGDSSTQGATISFNVLRANGTYVPYTSAVETLANERDIFVRSGQLCNPGGIATHLGFEKWHIQRLWAYGHRCGEHEVSGTEIYRGRPTGVVRVSLGAMTTMANVDALVTFLRGEFVLQSLGLQSDVTQDGSASLSIRKKDDFELNKAERSETGHDDDFQADQSQVDLRSYDFVPYSGHSSTTHVNLSPPSTGEGNESTIQIPSVASTAMSRSQADVCPFASVATVQKKGENNRLKSFLISKGRLRKSASTLS